MKQISTSSLAKILRLALTFIFALGLFLTPLCHWLLRLFYKQLLNTDLAGIIISTRNLSTTGSDPQYYLNLVQIYTLGFVMLGIVYQLIKICLNIEKNIPFDLTTHNALKKIAFLSLFLIVVYGVKFAIFPGLPCLLLMLTFTMIGIISSLFSQLFKKAAEYKEENEFTI